MDVVGQVSRARRRLVIGHPVVAERALLGDAEIGHLGLFALPLAPLALRRGGTVPAPLDHPDGQPATQVPHPLQTSSWTTTVPNSVRNSAPVGQTSRQPAWVQCLHTSDDISQRNSAVSGGATPLSADVSI